MTNMDPKTLAALKGSIAKWQAIVDGTGVDRGPRNCPLCLMFYDDGCRGCPVMASTGDPECSGSPYDAWADANSDDERAEAARAELAFLKSLAPDEVKP